MKKNILIILVCALIFTSLSVYATIKYQASEIEYNNTPLDEVLNDLYDKADNVGITSKKICKFIDGTYGTAGNVGAKYECDPGDGVKRRFYILTKNDNTIDLIMDRNITNSTSTTWQAAMEFFRSGTGANIKNNWTNVLNIDLPDAQAIADAVDNKSWIAVQKSSVSKDWFCLESKVADETNHCKTTNTGAAAWLYNNLNGCSQYQCTEEENNTEYAYWTRDIVANLNPTRSWGVRNSSLSTIPITDTNIGVRPVITVLKSNLYE